MKPHQIKVGAKFIIDKDRSRVYEIMDINGINITIKKPEGEVQTYVGLASTLTSSCTGKDFEVYNKMPFKIIHKWRLQ